MDTDHLKSILLILSKLSLSTWNLAKSICEGRSELSFESSDSPPTWCICRKCSIMPNERENVCFKNKTKNHEHPYFCQLVLDEKVLHLGTCDWLCYNFNPDENSSLYSLSAIVMKIHSLSAIHIVALGLSWKGQ